MSNADTDTLITKQQGRIKAVLVDSGSLSSENEREIIEQAGFEFDVFEGARDDREGRIAFAQGALGIVVRATVVDAAFLDALPGLKAVVRCGTGYDNIDVPAATQRGIRVANVQGYANEAVSDHALALIVACARGLSLGERLFRETFGHVPRPDIGELRSATLGIVGLGQIGGTLAGKVQALFARVLAYDPYIPKERFRALGAVDTDLDTLLAESHIISLHCSLTDETRGMIDARAFAMMRRRPVFVNTARGQIVDEQALLEALSEDRVHSAGIDVFSEEPPPPALDALLSHPRVIATGHYAFYSENAMVTLQRRAAQNLVALLLGESIPDCLNP